MSGMDDWEHWSVANSGAPVLTRAIVLHAWLTHIHPFTDGNGRTARAIMNLELVRGGFPCGHRTGGIECVAGDTGAVGALRSPLVALLVGSPHRHVCACIAGADLVEHDIAVRLSQPVEADSQLFARHNCLTIAAASASGTRLTS